MNEIWFSTIPQLLPSDLLARATSFDWLVSIISMPLGFAVTGPVADHIGIRTTLIAAEQTGRKAYLMELDALYCDVIVTRWEQFTGKKAKRISDVSEKTPAATAGVVRRGKK